MSACAVGTWSASGAGSRARCPRATTRCAPGRHLPAGLLPVGRRDPGLLESGGHRQVPPLGHPGAPAV
eukprot:1325746-Alexandrium_andersonii.AAC.1